MNGLLGRLTLLMLIGAGAIVGAIVGALPTVEAAETKMPMKVSVTVHGDGEQVFGLTVPDRDTTASAYGGKLRRYDVHIAKMVEVTSYFCGEDSGQTVYRWQYYAGEGALPMGNFDISCRLANDLVTAYSFMPRVEATVITYYGETPDGSARAPYSLTQEIPVLGITSGKVDRWMEFTQRFQPI
jgi:hypothetical protein